MGDIQYNDVTCMVEDSFFGYDFEQEVLPGKEDMEKLDAVTIFAEYALVHAKRCGYQKMMLISVSWHPLLSLDARSAVLRSAVKRSWIG